MIVGEGGFPRREFLYDLEWWEIMRIYHGIQRRYRAQYDTARQRDYIYCAAHHDRKNGPMPDSAYDWQPHAWDPLPDPSARQRDIDEARALLRRAQEETSESLETNNDQTAAE